MDAISVSVASNLDSADVTVKELYRKNTPIDRTPKTLPKFNIDHDKYYATYKRIFLTIAIYLTFISTGLSGGVFGPTLVHLEYLFDTDTKEMSLLFVGYNLGNLGGNILCALVFDRISHELQFTIWGTVAGLCCILLPFMPHIYFFFGIVLLEFFALGILYTGAQVYTLKLWVDYGYHRQVLQGSQLMWCLGNFLIPFIALPFLDELPKSTVVSNEGNSIETHLNSNRNNISNVHLFPDQTNKYNVTGTNPYYEKQSDDFTIYKVKYIFIIVGLVSLFQSLLFIIGFFLEGASCRNTATHRPVNEKKENKLVSHSISDSTALYVYSRKPKEKIAVLKVLMLSLLCIFILFHCWHRFVIGSFITLFTIKGLGWTTEKGALSTSVFYGFHALGSLFGVFISRYIDPARLIIIDQLFTTVGVILLLFSYMHDMIVWVSISLVGFVLATVSPSLLLWTLDYMPINGQIGALFMCGASVGGVTSTMLVGYLFEQYTHMWMVYISIISSVLCLVIFLSLLAIGRMIKHYTPCEDSDKLNENSNMIENNKEKPCCSKQCQN